MHTPARHILVAASVLLIGRGIPVPADGQGIDIDEGGWFVLGLGMGTANVSCDGCTRGWNSGGPTLLAQVGGTLSPHLRLGFGLDEWWYLPADSTAKLVKTATALLHYYAFGRRFYVEEGAGWSRVYVLVGRAEAKGNGLGLVSGLGYDVRVRGVKVAPRINYDYGLIGQVRFPDRGPPYARRGLFAKGWKHQVLSVGLGVGI
jgi:hypothetical protein